MKSSCGNQLHDMYVPSENYKILWWVDLDKQVKQQSSVKDLLFLPPLNGSWSPNEETNNFQALRPH